jgi:hypothetical protein
MTPLIGFSPDVDPTQPGVITECRNVIPTEFGLRGAPAPVDVGADDLAAACRGAATVFTVSGSRRLYAGAATRLYELSTTTWTDRSRAGNYTLGADDRWSFAQFGDSTLAATPAAILQRSTGGAFADVSGAPTAKIIVTASGFAVAFNTTTTSDEWYCCAYLDETDWALNVATQCVKGRLVQGPGEIRAAARLGDDIVAYKASSTYLGRYQGAPAVWNWTQASGDTGCVGPEAVVDTPRGHIFLGTDNLYLFDGSVPKPLATEPIRRWLFREMSGLYASASKLLWDKENQLVWIYYPGAGDTTCTRTVVYHVPSSRWGIADEAVEAVVTYTTSGVTYDGGAAFVTTYDSSPSIPFDSTFWQSGKPVPSVFNTTHTLSALAGTCASADLTTGDIGDDEGYTFCDEVRVRFIAAPTTATLTGQAKDEAGVTTVTQQSASKADGKFEMRQEARWHRFKLATTGDFTLTGIRPKLKPTGRR